MSFMTYHCRPNNYHTTHTHMYVLTDLNFIFKSITNINNVNLVDFNIRVNNYCRDL